ncbi:MAG: hypothetical protein H7263_13920 [Candidatus Sericytochromatia bacterium]|nr:hypothetical protein [Candidatus Sericytochromatia bacterium]
MAEQTDELVKKEESRPSSRRSGQQSKKIASSNSGARRTTAIIKGSSVLDGYSQDMFVPAGSEVVSQVRDKSIVEQIKEFSLGSIGSAVFNTVAANADANSENGIGANMQKALLNQMVEAMADTPDILSPEYRNIVREIIQGSMQAAKENEVRLQEAIKMVITGLMAISPHDDDTKVMSEAMKIMASEVMYGKVNLGYSMKLASHSLGASMFMLSIYFKNYQSKLEYTKQLDQKLKYACNDGIWEATGEISGYSEIHARTNTDRFVTGRIEEEKNFQKNLIKGMILMPLKRLENIGFVRSLMTRFGKK